MIRGAAGRFRLAGFGGTALVMRTCVFPWADPETGVMQGVPGVDLEVLTVTERRAWLTRETSIDFPDRWASYLRQIASEWRPEVSVPPIADEPLGFDVTVTHSTDSDVELQLRILVDPLAEEPHHWVVPLRTTRLAVLTAASGISVLRPFEGEDL